MDEICRKTATGLSPSSCHEQQIPHGPGCAAGKVAWIRHHQVVLLRRCGDLQGQGCRVQGLGFRV